MNKKRENAWYDPVRPRKFRLSRSLDFCFFRHVISIHDAFGVTALYFGGIVHVRHKGWARCGVDIRIDVTGHDTRLLHNDKNFITSGLIDGLVAFGYASGIAVEGAAFVMESMLEMEI